MRPAAPPGAARPGPGGRSFVQWDKGQLSCWLEPAEREVTLRCQCHCSRPPEPLQEPVQGAHTPAATYQLSGLQTVSTLSMRWKV